MITKNNPHDFTLQLSKTFLVNIERVYRAWTRPEELEKWWGPAGFKTTIVEMNLEVNGRYKFNMLAPNGELHVVAGQYQEIIPYEKLVFTWKWIDQDNEFPLTKVTVEFLEQGENTDVIISHSDLPSQEAAENHNHGWTSFLEDTLNAYLQ
ncbi:SRPBCC family protein [Bacillus sp. 2205SS5-2]|uniref:SRPBCC family protein n=1 Tax=Bacillus sp. 2205SS5-2 TaxID=3109031 RepID=UPI003003FFF6